MPIKPENAKRYPPPAEWKAMRASVLERADNKCEKCEVPNYAVVQWRDGKWHQAIDDLVSNYAAAKQIAAENSIGWEEGDPRWIVIVLTIAHLEHDDLETRDLTRLRAWCQRCHLAYDHQHHQQNSYATRRKGKAVSDLFSENPA